MTDTPPARTHPVRCHICAALIPNLPDDRRLHIGLHESDRKALNAIRRELTTAKDSARTAADDARQIRVRLEEDIATMREQVTALTAPDDDGLTYDTWPEDELQLDTGNDEVSLEQPDAGEPAEHPTDDTTVGLNNYFLPTSRDDTNA